MSESAQAIGAPRERDPFWGYQDLAVFIALAVPSLLLGTMAAKLMFGAANVHPGRATEALATQFLGYGFWFLSLYALLEFRYSRPFWRSLGWVWPGFRVVARCLVAGPWLAIAVGFCAWLIRAPNIPMPIKDLLNDGMSIAFMGVFVTTLGPVFEELAFRGFLLPLVARSIGSVAGVFLTALPFALMHGPQYAWSWRHLLLLTLASAVFGWIRLASRSTAAAALTHATYNMTFFVIYLLQHDTM